MATYVQRTIDAELDALLNELPAISVEGCKGVGKTVTTRRRSSTVFELDDERQAALLSANSQAWLLGSPARF